MGPRVRQLCGSRRLGRLALLAAAHEPDRPVSHDRRVRARRVDLRLLHPGRRQSVGRAAPADGVCCRDRHRGVEVAHGSHAEAVVEPVPTRGPRLPGDRHGEQVRLRRLDRDPRSVVAGAWDLPTWADAATSAVGKNVVTVLLLGVAPIVFLAFIVRRRASMPASVRATSRPAFVAAALFGIAELWAFASTMADLGGFGGRSTSIGMVGACLAFGSYGAVALLLVWSESMRRGAGPPLHRARRPSSWVPRGRARCVRGGRQDPG